MQGGFFGEDKPSFEQKAAHKLFTLLSAKRKLFRKVNLKAWAREFAQLQEGGVDRARIKAAFKFYAKTIGQEFIPQIYSAKAFCMKFAQLEDAMSKRTDASSAKAASDNVAVSKEARTIASRLSSEHSWPGALASQLPAVVQQSLDNFKDYERKRAAAVARWKKLTRSEMAKIAQRARMLLDFDDVLNDDGWLSSTPAEFVENWFAYVAKRLAKWKDFHGQLSHFTFSLAHPDADAQGRREAVQWSGDDEIWVKYISRINES